MGVNFIEVLNGDFELLDLSRFFDSRVTRGLTADTIIDGKMVRVTPMIVGSGGETPEPRQGLNMVPMAQGLSIRITVAALFSGRTAFPLDKRHAILV